MSETSLGTAKLVKYISEELNVPFVIFDYFRVDSLTEVL